MKKSAPLSCEKETERRRETSTGTQARNQKAFLDKRKNNKAEP